MSRVIGCCSTQLYVSASSRFRIQTLFSFFFLVPLLTLTPIVREPLLPGQVVTSIQVTKRMCARHVVTITGLLINTHTLMAKKPVFT